MLTDRRARLTDLSDRGLYQGVQVQAKFPGYGDEFYPGRITRVNVDGTLTVLFDDGYEADVSPHDMRVSSDPWWRLREGESIEQELALAQSPLPARRPASASAAPAAVPPPALECEAAEPTPELLLSNLRRYIVVECGGDGASVDGWGVDLRRREGGAARARDLYYFSPTRERFRSRVEVARHLGLAVPAPSLPGSARGHARPPSSPPPRAPSCEPPRKRAAVASTARRPTAISAAAGDDDDDADDEHTTELLRRATDASVAPEGPTMAGCAAGDASVIAPSVADGGAPAEGDGASADDDEFGEHKRGESAARTRAGTGRSTPALGADRPPALRVLFFLECHSGSCRIAQAHLRHVRRTRARDPRGRERLRGPSERRRARRNGTS